MHRSILVAIAALTLACGTLSSTPDVAAPPPELESGEPLRRLPDTASGVHTLGLAGAGSLAAALALRALRRRYFR